MAYNPFKNRLVRPSYDVTNIKKVFDVFPRSLRVKQLTSEQLLEQLQIQLLQRNVRIEELLSLINQLREQSLSFEELQTLVSQLSGTLDSDVSSLLQDLIKFSGDAQKQSKIDSLLGRGFIRIGNSDLFVKVNSTESRTFYLRSDNEGRDRQLQMVSPTSVVFSNVSETNSIYFFKRELWDYTTESKYNDDVLGRFDGDPFSPTNIFVFQKYPNLYSTVSVISAGQEITTPVVLPNPDISFQDAELRRDGKEARWEGSMYIYASNSASSSPQSLLSSDYSSIGSITLYRKRTD